MADSHSRFSFSDQDSDLFTVPKPLQNGGIPDEMPKFGLADPSALRYAVDYFSGKERPRFSFDPEAFAASSMARHQYTNAGMYGFVSWRWVRPFAKWVGDRRCLEIMSGRGYWAKALRACGVSVVATDNASWGIHDPVTEVDYLEAIDAIKQYGASCELLLLSWPPMSAAAHQALVAWESVHPGGLVVFIGELGGCTADARFARHFDLVDDRAFDQAAAQFESWPMIRDQLLLGRFRP